MTTKNINSYASQIGNNEYNAMTYPYLTLWQKEEAHEMVPQKFILIAWILENKECCQQVEKISFQEYMWLKYIRYEQYVSYNDFVELWLGNEEEILQQLEDKRCLKEKLY